MTLGAGNGSAASTSSDPVAPAAREAAIALAACTSKRTSIGVRDTRSIARCTTPFMRLPRYSAAKALGAATTRQPSVMAIPTVCLRKVS